MRQVPILCLARSILDSTASRALYVSYISVLSLGYNSETPNHWGDYLCDTRELESHRELFLRDEGRFYSRQLAGPLPARYNLLYERTPQCYLRNHSSIRCDLAIRHTSVLNPGASDQRLNAANICAAAAGANWPLQWGLFRRRSYLVRARHGYLPGDGRVLVEPVRSSGGWV